LVEFIPAVSDEMVVWDDSFFGDYNIYFADIYLPSRPAEFAITSQVSEQVNPELIRGA